MTDLSPAAQDAECYEFLSEWFEYTTSSPSCISWKKRPPHGRKGAGEHCCYFAKYYRVRLFGRWYQCHRIVLILNGLKPLPGQIADHVDRDRKNNRIENLRWATESQNRRSAQAVLDACDQAFDQCGTTAQGLAATLRAAADQLQERKPRPSIGIDWSSSELYAIAAELEGL